MSDQSVRIKVSADQVNEILKQLDQGATLAAIARDLDVTTASVYRALARAGKSSRAFARTDLLALRREVETMAPRDAVSILLDILESSLSEMAPSKLAPLIRAGFSPQQARILLILDDANGAVSYSHILTRLDNTGTSASEMSVHQQIFRMRRKLKEIASTARIETVWGEGLMLTGELPSLWPASIKG